MSRNYAHQFALAADPKMGYCIQSTWSQWRDAASRLISTDCPAFARHILALENMTHGSPRRITVQSR